MNRSDSEFFVCLLCADKQRRKTSRTRGCGCSCRKKCDKRSCQCIRKKLLCSSACENCPIGEHPCSNDFGKSEIRLYVQSVNENIGYGVFAGQSIPRDSFISEFCGTEIESVQKRRASDYIVKVQEGFYIDATKEGSIARFLNHSCEPNCHAKKR